MKKDVKARNAFWGNAKNFVVCAYRKISIFLLAAKEVLIKLALLLLNRIGFCFGASEDATDTFERGKQIVPDCVIPNEDEKTIRQYNVAKLRSRILQKYAEGRLQVTNKRVIFRAAGFSLMGSIRLQYEFSISELGGIDAKKSYRFSFLNFLLGFLLTGVISEPLRQIFENFYDVSEQTACVVGCIAALLLAVSILTFQKHFWIKHILLSCATGIMLGISSLTTAAWQIAMGVYFFDAIDVVTSVVEFVWLCNLIITSLVPELRLTIRTKAASETVQIRKKVWGFLFRKPQEYTDFGEVLPWSDSDRAINELGALIDDLQTMGDYAIDKWKESE